MKGEEYVRIEDLKRLDFIVRNIQKHKDARHSRILDLGCGNGLMSRYLGERGYRVHGVDISCEAIRLARQATTLPNVTFEVAAAEKLRESHLRYDVIICSELLEHLDDPQSLISVVRDLLYRDGKLIVTVPNGKGPREILVTRPVQRIHESGGRISQFVSAVKSLLGYDGTTVQSAADDLTHRQFFSKKSLIALLESSGFSLDILEHSDCFEAVFPFSLLTRRFRLLQRLDCALANVMPPPFVSGFYTAWSKNDGH